jgi:demethylmenaquinone methyltransferase / 2-methoxy-6-polyprenyl-1,4-benzoquinol methylase
MPAKTPQSPPRDEIWKMFDIISPTYDLMNRVMTLGLDKYWRKKMISFLPPKADIHLLDCATGTGDQLITFMEGSEKIHQAYGIDLAKEMLRLGEKKIQGKPYAEKVVFQEASAMALPYPDNTFDCASMSFGIRNVTDVLLCLKEIYRVLSPQGRILILECSIPSNPVIKAAHLFYMRKILPRLGAVISKDKKAYRYLNETVETFPSGENFCSIMKNAGFSQVHANPLALGAVSIYQGDK